MDTLRVSKLTEDERKTKMKRESILNYMQEEAYKPLTIHELEEVFGVTGSENFKAFVKLLVAMEEDGDIVRTRSNRYGLPHLMRLIRGELIGNQRGFAFVVREKKGEPDIFIPPAGLNSAMHGDTVFVRLDPYCVGKRPEGEVVKIIRRGVTRLVGTYDEIKNYGFVIPDDKKISSDVFIKREDTNGAVDGHKVVVELTSYPEERRSAEGKIVEILGHKNDPGVDILSIIYKYGLPMEFSPEVLAEANRVPDVPDARDYEHRRDLRDEIIVTIDGEDAKDLDDAVQVVRMQNGNYLLGVHIADVSHYVKAGSAIDQEALARGTSVYLVDRVIPMLPHRLSNGICSLNPQVDRLTLSCEMEITPKGEVISHEIFQSVIRTTERMTYTAVNEILTEKNEETREKYASLVPMFEDMEDLAAILRKARFKRGSMDFDTKEAKILVDGSGHPTDIQLRERGVGEKLIEEFMLKANETVAEHFYRLKVPFLYRIHEEPKEDKLENFLQFIANFGLHVRGLGEEIEPKALQQILNHVEDLPEKTIISTVLLRSMKQAKYSEECLGHFGLATDFYTHFTSPIRRYPDLIVHRFIRKYLIEGNRKKETLDMLNETLPDIAEHTSRRERRAVDAERETDALKKAEFMLDKIDEEFDGIISSVTNFGMFVELPNTVEGLVHMSNLTDDYYNFDERHYALIGKRTGTVFRIGDEVKVRCIAVNKDEHAVDFEIVGMKGKKRVSQRKPVTIKATSSDSYGSYKKKKAKKSGRKKEDDKGYEKKRAKSKKAKKKGGFYESVPSLKRPGKKKKNKR